MYSSYPWHSEHAYRDLAFRALRPLPATSMLHATLAKLASLGHDQHLEKIARTPFYSRLAQLPGDLSKAKGAIQSAGARYGAHPEMMNLKSTFADISGQFQGDFSDLVQGGVRAIVGSPAVGRGITAARQALPQAAANARQMAGDVARDVRTSAPAALGKTMEGAASALKPLPLAQMPKPPTIQGRLPDNYTAPSENLRRLGVRLPGQG